MIGIYKITNKLNGKSYIGQSIHCGKRLDEHCKGSQFIDEIIQLEGIDNFNFEILKETSREELSYWEDYYILKYNTFFPNGYNRRWNCNELVRKSIKQNLNLEEQLKQKQEKLLQISFEQKKEEQKFLKDYTYSELEKMGSKVIYFYLKLFLNANTNKDNRHYYFKRDLSTRKINKLTNGIDYCTQNKYFSILNNFFENIDDKVYIKPILNLTNYFKKEDVNSLNDKELYVLWKIKRMNEDGHELFRLKDLSWNHGDSAALCNKKIKMILEKLSELGFIKFSYEINKQNAWTNLKISSY